MRKFFISFIFVGIAIVNGQSNQTCQSICPANIQIAWWKIPPYMYEDASNKKRGIFSQVITKLIKECCGTCTKLEYREGHSDSESLKEKVDKIITNNTEKQGALYFPIYGTMTTVKFQSKSFFPVVESPGVIFIQSAQENGNAAESVMKAVLQGWPVLVLTLIMAALSGIVMWALVRITANMGIFCFLRRKTYVTLGKPPVAASELRKEILHNDRPANVLR